MIKVQPARGSRREFEEWALDHGIRSRSGVQWTLSEEQLNVVPSALLEGAWTSQPPSTSADEDDAAQAESTSGSFLSESEEEQDG